MTQLDNVNRALAEIGTRSRITVVDDSTTEGLYASMLYPMLKECMLRMGDYDFAMEQISATSVVVPGQIWRYAYEYPSDVLRIRQAIPAVPDRFDPQPAEFNIYNLGGFRVVASNHVLTDLICTISNPNEDIWDPQFTDAFIRYFASAMTMALENRLEASEAVLKNAIGFAGLANMRDG